MSDFGSLSDVRLQCLEFRHVGRLTTCWASPPVLVMSEDEPPASRVLLVVYKQAEEGVA
jgi:hypothetical protein